jgi:hypothetical protein
MHIYDAEGNYVGFGHTCNEVINLIEVANQATGGWSGI